MLSEAAKSVLSNTPILFTMGPFVYQQPDERRKLVFNLLMSFALIMENEYDLPFDTAVSVCVGLGLCYGNVGKQYSHQFWTNYLHSVVTAEERGGQNLSQNSDEIDDYIQLFKTLVRVELVSSGGVTGAKVWFRTPIKRLDVKVMEPLWDTMASKIYNDARTAYQNNGLWGEYGSVEMKELVMKFENEVPMEEWPGDE
jgi:hypothetical protein